MKPYLKPSQKSKKLEHLLNQVGNSDEQLQPGRYRSKIRSQKDGGRVELYRCRYKQF